MHFELLPDTFRKSVNVKEGKVEKTIRFDAPLVLSGESTHDPSTLKDGRAIASFACPTFIRAKEGGDDSGIISFVPAFSVDDLRIDESDSLELNVALPTDAFSELWIAVQQGHNIIPGGEVDGLPRKDSLVLWPDSLSI